MRPVEIFLIHDMHYSEEYSGFQRGEKIGLVNKRDHGPSLRGRFAGPPELSSIGPRFLPFSRSEI